MAVNPENAPLTPKGLLLWGTIFVSIFGMLGTAVAAYISLRLDVTVTQHDVVHNAARLDHVETRQDSQDKQVTEMDKKLTEVVTILREHFGPAKEDKAH